MHEEREREKKREEVLSLISVSLSKLVKQYMHHQKYVIGNKYYNVQML